MRYVVTWAQNNTRPHAAFLASLRRYPAKLLVVRGFYRNPTSLAESEGLSKEVAWHPDLTDHLVDDDRALAQRLMLYASIRVSPTASKPISGFDALTGQMSGIVGHPRRHLRCVASDSRSPRLLASTGAVTLPHYSASKAGAKARKHHTLGALVVETRDDGVYFVRQITWDAIGQGFTDLGLTYTPEGVSEAKPAAALVVGDVHWGVTCNDALHATFGQIDRLRPQQVVLHDFFDCRTRNHHDKRDARSRHLYARSEVRSEVSRAVEGLRLFAGRARKAHPDSRVVVVRSNHDEALDRWAFEEHDPARDPANTPYWHEVSLVAYEYFRKEGRFPLLFPEMVRRGWGGGEDAPHFLSRDESYMVHGIQLGFHGHSGINGAKGTPSTYSSLGVKVVVGHSHSPWICDGGVGVGHITTGDLGYNHNPTTWAKANCVIYADGKRSLLFIFGRDWSADDNRG